MKEATISGAEEVHESDKPPPIIHFNWFYRMVSSIKTHLSLRPQREGDVGLHCIYRKFGFAMGIVEFY